MRARTPDDESEERRNDNGDRAKVPNRVPTKRNTEAFLGVAWSDWSDSLIFKFSNESSNYLHASKTEYLF